MAEKNRADLQAVIDANLPDNTTDFITPLLHREVEEDLNTDAESDLEIVMYDGRRRTHDWGYDGRRNDGRYIRSKYWTISCTIRT